MAADALPKGVESDITSPTGLELVSPLGDQESHLHELVDSLGDLLTEIGKVPVEVVAGAYSDAIAEARADHQDPALLRKRDMLRGFLPEPLADKVMLDAYRELPPGSAD